MKTSDNVRIIMNQQKEEKIGKIQMKEKNDKDETKIHQAHPYEFVNSNVLNYLIGSAPQTLREDRDNEKFHKISFIYVGSVRKYSFYDAAKLVHPGLTNYEIAKLRVEINAIMIAERKKNKAGKSRSKEE
jgi:hypothetical protein